LIHFFVVLYDTASKQKQFKESSRNKEPIISEHKNK